MTEIVPLESEEQIAFVQWLSLKGIKYTSIPNNTYTTSPKQKAHNTEMGLQRGLPDLLIAFPNEFLVFIEMKRRKKSLSVTSPEQEEWIRVLDSIENVGAHVCYGADEAIEVIEKYLSLIRPVQTS